MKKLFNNLPFRLLLGIIIGVILGQVFPESVMKVVVTLQYIMGQLITFCVPLIIIGFIAPSITKLGKNASRLLGVAIVIAYVSSSCSLAAARKVSLRIEYFDKNRFMKQVAASRGSVILHLDNGSTCDLKKDNEASAIFQTLDAPKKGFSISVSDPADVTGFLRYMLEAGRAC